MSSRKSWVATIVRKTTTRILIATMLVDVSLSFRRSGVIRPWECRSARSRRSPTTGGIRRQRRFPRYSFRRRSPRRDNCFSWRGRTITRRMMLGISQVIGATTISWSGRTGSEATEPMSRPSRWVTTGIDSIKSCRAPSGAGLRWASDTISTRVVTYWLAMNRKTSVVAA